MSGPQEAFPSGVVYEYLKKATPLGLLHWSGHSGLGCTMFLVMQLQEGLLPTASPSTKLARLWVLRLTFAEAVCLVPQQAEVAIHAVDTQWPLVSYVTLAGPVALSAAISTAVAVSAARPLRPTLAHLEDRNLCLEHVLGGGHDVLKQGESQHLSTCSQPNSHQDA